ncbi:MAG: M24 family metallopeptidase, partial [Calditrichaeota bacterium]|nr:M24 family metallopeptidase [Calditrichota bacterium]
ADKFTHGLGHGLGVEVHSKPAVSAMSKVILKQGMVVTIEPGIYIEGYGGVRIEDDVVITKDGFEVLNKSTKELIEL